MAKSRRTEFDVIIENKTFKAGGCHSWTIINRGNTNVTIGGTYVLMPSESVGSPEESEHIIDESEFECLFDNANAPLFKAPDTGALADSFSYVSGVDPVPEKNNKLVILRSYIK